jgi:hypothetical protein
MVVPHCNNPTRSPFGQGARASLSRNRRSNAGENNGAAKLNRRLVRDIRTLYSDGGESHRSLASQFKCSYSNVGSVLRLETWR